MSVIAMPRSVAPEGRARARWSMTVSVLLHAALLAWLILQPHHARDDASITEITLLGPGDLADTAPAAPAAAAAETAPGVLAAASREERFQRSESRAAVAPDPQLAVSDDRLEQRLAEMQNTASAPTLGAVSATNASLWGAAPATVAGTGGGGSAPIALHRGDKLGGGAPLALSRGGSGLGFAPALAPALPAERHAEAPGKPGDNGVRRTLAGATLMGPIADRPVLSHVTPLYPEWAKREGVEGSVTVYFVVGPDGTVRENVLVQKTAGFDDFDQSACSALKAWRFEPLHDGRVGDQWGTITFHFRLRESG